MPRWPAVTPLAIYTLLVATLVTLLVLRFLSEQPVVTPEARKYLNIAQDERQPYDERRQAVVALKDLDRDGVGALLQLVPGGYDVVTFDAIRALGEIGDPRAIPQLRNFGADGGEIPGKLNTARWFAIEAIEKKQRDQARERGTTPGMPGPLLRMR